MDDCGLWGFKLVGYLMEETSFKLRCLCEHDRDELEKIPGLSVLVASLHKELFDRHYAIQRGDAKALPYLRHAAIALYGIAGMCQLGSIKLGKVMRERNFRCSADALFVAYSGLCELIGEQPEEVPF